MNGTVQHATHSRTRGHMHAFAYGRSTHSSHAHAQHRHRTDIYAYLRWGRTAAKSKRITTADTRPLTSAALVGTCAVRMHAHVIFSQSPPLCMHAHVIFSQSPSPPLRMHAHVIFSQSPPPLIVYRNRLRHPHSHTSAQYSAADRKSEREIRSLVNARPV